MSIFFDWLISFFKQEVPEKKDSKSVPVEVRKESIPEKKLIITRRQNVVEQPKEVMERRATNRLNNFSEEKKRNYKKGNYKKRKRPDSENRKQDV